MSSRRYCRSTPLFRANKKLPPADGGNACCDPRGLLPHHLEGLEVPAADIAGRLGSRRQVWRDIRADGLVVYGLSLAELEGSDDG